MTGFSTIKGVLTHKGHEVHSVDVGSSVADAVHKMAGLGIGSVLIRGEDRIVGILTERDLARRVAYGRMDTQTTSVEAVMTSRLAYVSPETRVEEAMKVMSETHCRHLPVFEDGALVGLVSLGDLLRFITGDLETHISYLESYIRGW